MSLAKRIRGARRQAFRLWLVTSGVCVGIVIATVMAALTRFDQWRDLR